MEEPIFVVEGEKDAPITPGKIKSKKRKRKLLIINGIIDTGIILSLIYLLLAYGSYLLAEGQYYVRLALGKTYILAEDVASAGPNPANSVWGSIVEGLPEISIEPKSRDFGLIIEKIGVNESVVADVDPTNKDEYRAALKTGIAHARGTAFPDNQNGNVYLFAHSTTNIWDIIQYKSYFTLLRKLEIGDRVIVFYKGVRYDYQVYERKIIDPSDTSDLAGYAYTPTLTLQTCEPPGSDARRLIVKARLVGASY